MGDGQRSGFMSVAQMLMKTLYGHDIWEGFNPVSSPSQQIQGWNGNHPSLKRLCTIPGPDKIVLDVGVWKGQSTITMADSMRRANIDGCVVAIDTFLGSTEHWGTNLFLRQHARPNLYETFLDNVYYAGLTKYVIPFPQTSLIAAAVLKNFHISASMVHIDAAHEYRSVMFDAEAFWQILCPGGWLVGDDYHETWPGVVRAAGEFSSRVVRPLVIEPPKWLLQKNRI